MGSPVVLASFLALVVVLLFLKHDPGLHDPQWYEIAIGVIFAGLFCSLFPAVEAAKARLMGFCPFV